MSGQPLLQDVNAEHGLPAELDVLLLLIAAEGVLVLLVPYLLLLEFRGLLHEMEGKRKKEGGREGGRKGGREEGREGGREGGRDMKVEHSILYKLQVCKTLYVHCVSSLQMIIQGSCKVVLQNTQ